MQKKHVFLMAPVVGPPILTFLQLTETAFNGTMTVYDIVPMENELNLLNRQIDHKSHYVKTTKNFNFC